MSASTGLLSPVQIRRRASGGAFRAESAEAVQKTLEEQNAAVKTYLAHLKAAQSTTGAR